MAGQQGGKREGAGRPPGALGKATLSKAEAREALRQAVIAHMPEMVAAQVAHSKGIKYLVARARTGGKFEKVSPDKLEEMLAGPRGPADLGRLSERLDSVSASCKSCHAAHRD